LIGVLMVEKDPGDVAFCSMCFLRATEKYRVFWRLNIGAAATDHTTSNTVDFERTRGVFGVRQKQFPFFNVACRARVYFYFSYFMD
jgi:hypothetical protein